jgi:signal transduction histidine kinase
MDHPLTEPMLQALTRAALAVSRQLALDGTLQQIVDAARELAGARYAALGVPDETEGLSAFVYSGLSPAEAARIDHPPVGRGLLGALLREGRSLRLRDLREDPRSAGFPPGHPPMTSFLGVPVPGPERIYGRLYLTDKIGGGEFSESDQALVELLAAHAAAAIHNAHLYQAAVDRGRELEARNRELAAVNAVAAASSQHLDLGRVLSEALEQVLAVTGAEAGEIFLVTEPRGDLQLALHRGELAGAFQTLRHFKPGQGFHGRVAASGEALVTTDLASEAAYLRREVIGAGFRAYACLPLWAKGRVVGTLGLAARDPQVFDNANLSLLAGIGHQVGVAIENARLYEQVGRLAVLEERARISMDLHDGVIQSIYAVGLTLEYIQLLLDEDPAAAHQRLQQAIDGLNGVIRDLRNYILDLRPQQFEGDLTAGLARLAREFQANTLTTVELECSLEDSQQLGLTTAKALFHIAQEALANVAKHARASHARVELRQTDGCVRLRIADNGRGFDLGASNERVGHGLTNIRTRAEGLAGTLRVESAPGQGTILDIVVPVE